jgi:single-strand DNA-binding protein
MSAFNKHIVSGRLGRKPELRYTPNGVAVTSFSLVRQPRKRNAQTNEWEDGDPTWYEITAFNRLAENVVASLDKGHEVTVFGELKLSSYMTKENEARHNLDLTADDIAISLDHQIAPVTEKSAYGNKTSGGVSNGGSNTYNNRGSSYSSPAAPAAVAADDNTPF